MFSLRTLTRSVAFLALMTWAMPAWAVDPDLIDALEINDTHNPIIVHENILPGDSFSDVMTVKNVSSGPNEGTFDLGMRLDIDTSQGIWNFPNFKLEQEIMVKIERDGNLITLPNGFTESPLKDLDGMTIALGSIAPGVTSIYKVLAYFDIAAGNEYQNTKVYFNLNIGVDILGETPRLRLSKVNDSVGDEAPGNTVDYSLTVTALGGDVNDVLLTDLPPDGFVYEPGSGTGAPFIHEYASPGVWDIGDLSAGESKTVHYTAKISGSQTAGIYPDIAFAKGTSAGGTNIIANGEDAPFVGTQVTVAVNDNPSVQLDKDKETKEKVTHKTKTRYVLGASLPATGTDLRIVSLAALLLIGGTILLFVTRKRKELMSLLVIGLSLTVFSLPGVADAATTLSVKIETPDPIVQSPNFLLGFTTLDILGRNLTVECYTEGNPVPFATYPLASTFGGNAGSCAVNASAMPTDGEYMFFVRAKADGGVEMIESAHVPVTLASSVPGIPTDYDRNDNNCEQVISFTTANDAGKTVKIELYRSKDNPFTANASTKVGELVIGSATHGSITDTLPPGCNEDVFYAIRAVTGNGNGSGFVGDKDVTVDTNHTTKTKTNTVTIPGRATGALPAAAGNGNNTSETQAVEGVNTENVQSEEEKTSNVGEVLGEMTTNPSQLSFFSRLWQLLHTHPWWSAIGVVILLFFIRYGYRHRAAKRTPEVPME